MTRVVLLRRRVAAADGFTLIELLVAIAILGLILGAVAGLLSTTVTTSSTVIDETTLQTEARATLDRLVAELRQVYTGSASTPAIASMSTSSITFYAPDRQQPFHLLEISYRLSGGQFQRAVASSSNTDGPPWSIGSLGAWSSEIDSVSDTDVFTYEDANGDPTTDPASVSTIGITLTVASTGGTPTTFQGTATIRETSDT